MTKYGPEVSGTKATAFEQHNAQQCRYVRQSEVRNVNGKERELFYWIRSCECGNQVDRSNLLTVDTINLDREDGVEIHLKENCKWSEIGKPLFNPVSYQCIIIRRNIMLRFILFSQHTEYMWRYIISDEKLDWSAGDPCKNFERKCFCLLYLSCQ